MHVAEQTICLPKVATPRTVSIIDLPRHEQRHLIDLRTWSLPLFLSAAAHAAFVLSFQTPSATEPAANVETVSVPWMNVALIRPEAPEDANIAARAELEHLAQGVAWTSAEFEWKPTPIARIIPRRVDVPLSPVNPDTFVQAIAVSLVGPDDAAIAQGLVAVRGMITEAGSDGDAVYSISEVDRPPVPIFQTSPRLERTLEARMAGHSIHAQFVVTKDGYVINIRIADCPEVAALEPTMAALEQWRFIAAKKRGRFVNVRVRQELRFHVRSPFHVPGSSRL